MKYHIVQVNEKIKDISNKYNVSVEEIIKLNRHINNIENVVPGMKIRIPVLSDEVSDQIKENFLDIEKYYPKMDDFKDAKVEKKDNDMYANKEEFAGETEEIANKNQELPQIPAQGQTYYNPPQYYPYNPQFNYYPQQPVYPAYNPQQQVSYPMYPNYRSTNVPQYNNYIQNPYQTYNYNNANVPQNLNAQPDNNIKTYQNPYLAYNYTNVNEDNSRPEVQIKKEEAEEIPVIIDVPKEKAEVKLPDNPQYSPFLFNQPATCDPALLDVCEEKSPVYQPYTNFFQNPLFTPPYPCYKPQEADEFNFSCEIPQTENKQEVSEFDEKTKEIKADLRDFVRKHTKIQKKKDFKDLL